MANSKAARPGQLIKTIRDDAGVSFFDRRTEQQIGRINMIELRDQEPEYFLRAAVHGTTQNILDASNKLEGDDRVAFIAQACDLASAGSWASAPSEIDPDKARAAAIKAFMALGLSPEAAASAVDAAL